MSYTIKEAAFLAGTSKHLSRRWFKKFRGNINFYELIELHVVSKLKKCGNNLKTIKKLHKDLCKEYKTEYPFAHKFFPKHIEQPEYGYVTLDSTRLKAKLDFNKDDILPSQWHIFNDIVIDPKRCSGFPVLTSVNTLTYVLYRSYLADGCYDLVGRLYDVSSRLVRNSVEFEQMLEERYSENNYCIWNIF